MSDDLFSKESKMEDGNLILYKVTLKGMKENSTGTLYGIAYVIDYNPSFAYRQVRQFLDENDIGFPKQRVLDKIEPIAEADRMTEFSHILYIQPLFDQELLTAKYNQLAEAQQQYIDLLEKEISRTSVYLAIHNMSCSDDIANKVTEYRNTIEIIKTQIKKISQWNK